MLELGPNSFLLAKRAWRSSSVNGRAVSMKNIQEAVILGWTSTKKGSLLTL